MKKIISILLLVLISISVYAVEDIEKLMVEKAATPQEKKAIHKYLLKEAENRKKMAERLREMASVKKGGKATTQINHQKEMLEEAKSLEDSAKEYEELATKVEK